MKQEKLQKFYKNLAEEYNLPLPIIRNIVQHQFQFTKKKMQSDEMPDIRLHYLGLFGIKRGRVDHFIRIGIQQYKKDKITRQECKDKLEKLFKLRKKFKKYDR